MQTMYSGKVNSPQSELSTAITDTDTEIELLDSSVLPPAPNLAVILAGEISETIRYAGIDGNKLTGVERGFQGDAQTWQAGTKVARYFNAYDHDAFKSNIDGLYDRLDTAATNPLTLQPGLQVINSAKDTRFKLGEIKGKSEINGQGRTGIVGVENPYVINTADNLLPPFYEWEDLDYGGGKSTILSPYEIIVSSKDVNNRAMRRIVVPVLPGKTYTFSGTILNTTGQRDALFFYWLDSDGQRLSGEDIPTRKYPGTYTVPSNAFYAQVHVIIDDFGDGSTFKTQTIIDPALVVGSEAKPFKPQRKSMLAFQTELHANPTNGNDPDVLFEQNSEYKKLAKWKKVALDGTLPWAFSNTFTGYKQLYLTNFPLSRVSDVGFATKFNGNQLQLLTTTSSDTSADQFKILTNTNMVINVANIDSGWGDSYTPTADEIKAYFNGWKMGTAEDGTIYNGTGTKCWAPIANPSNMHGQGWYDFVISNVPASLAPVSGGYVYHPYNLLCRLAKEVVEPVISEGCLMLTEGDNMVEVGTGIVLREAVKPIAGSSGSLFGVNYNLAYPGASFRFKTNDIRFIYRNSLQDMGWYNWKNIDFVASNGGAYAEINTYKFDQSSAYSFTYIKLDKSPIQPITGTLAANEKAQISDLTAGVAEALQRVSVVEQKKAEKDAPGWITPTLLNGAVQGPVPISYKKLSNGLVLFRGVCVPAATGVFCKIIQDYAPESPQIFSVLSIDGQGTMTPCNIEVRTNGEVYVGFFGSLYISLSDVVYQSKQ
ncbi:hypothetical protein D3C74_137500 [compost metagenome]